MFCTTKSDYVISLIDIIFFIEVNVYFTITIGTIQFFHSNYSFDEIIELSYICVYQDSFDKKVTF